MHGTFCAALGARATAAPAFHPPQRVLRTVGTFPVQKPTNTQGIVAPGVPPVLEVRQADMTTLALGASGFNIPSLLGLTTLGSYFHAGNARTLEEVFDSTFDAHLRALKKGFLTDEKTRKSDVADLVAHLSSIDDALEPAPGPGMTTDLGVELDLCDQ